MIIPRPYQQAAVDAVYEHLRTKDNNPCVVLPTGCGKAVILAMIASDVVQKWNGRVLILAHVKELLEQNAGKVKMFCPDLKIGIYSAGLKSRDTDEQVIVAGIQSVHNKACDLGAFDIIICDECHLLNSDLDDSMYKSFLNDMKIVNPHVRVVGLTATPFRLKGGLICKPENILNEICYEAGLKEMIQQGYLSPLISKSGRAEAKLDNLHIRGGEFINDEVSAAMDTDELVSSACREIVDLTHDRKSVLIFTTSVEHCKHVADMIQKFSGKECAIVTGDTSPGERAEIIDRFKGKFVPADLFGTPKPPLKFLANVNVLTTGFDAPNTDCVVLLRPTNSAGLLIQMVGRGTRLSPETGKQNCIAEGTPILTNKGVFPIEKVTKEMLVWDGVEFVSHDGAVLQGVQNVITYAGLTATPDHKVWCGNHWRTFGSCASERIPISVTGNNGEAIREADGYFRFNHGNKRIVFTKGQETINSQKKICSNNLPVWRDCMEKLGQSQQKYCGMPCLRQAKTGSSLVAPKGYSSKATLRKSKRSPICRLWWARNPLLFRWTNRNGSMVNEQFRLFKSKTANRPYKQQWGLRTGKFTDDIFKHQCNEHSTSKQNKDVTLQNETSGNTLCGCDSLQIFQQRNDGDRNHQEILYPVSKTQRRVWDILNAGPRHRFTAAGLLVSNCLVLDYGGNILRHGPVDMIKVKEPGSGKGGDAPAKKCPQCRALIHAGYTVCPECGHDFPRSSSDNMTETAYKAGVISGQADYTDYDVMETFYWVHEKRGAEPDAPRTMRIDYMVGFNEFKSEWVCPEHTGYARGKFEKWWRERAAIGCSVPSTAREAVAMANSGLLAETKSITVKTVAGERFDKIIRWRLGERPVMREPGDDTDEIVDWYRNSPADLGISQEELDEIPF